MKLLENIEALTKASSHLKYIEELMRRNPPSPDLQRKVAQEVAAIHKRRHDENLYVAIVGRASTGKSTLINALLEDSLLKSGTLQMTTAIATFVRYGESLSLEVRFKDVRSLELFGLKAQHRHQEVHESE